MALWHLDALCYEGCEGHGSANGLPQPRMELAEVNHDTFPDFDVGGMGFIPERLMMMMMMMMMCLWMFETTIAALVLFFSWHPPVPLTPAPTLTLTLTLSFCSFTCVVCLPAMPEGLLHKILYYRYNNIIDMFKLIIGPLCVYPSANCYNNTIDIPSCKYTNCVN